MLKCIKLNKEEFSQFMKDQLKQIEHDKYLDSLLAGKDLYFECYVEQWISKNAKQFREDWIIKNILKEI